MFSQLNAGDWFDTPLGKVQIRDALGKGKSGYSYLVRLGARQLVLKGMHDEPVPYYQFQDNKVVLEFTAYQRLKQLRLPIPELLHYDAEAGYLLKEYIPGQVAHEVIADGQLQEEVISQLIALARRAQQAGINLDYFPSNFVIDGHRLCYVDYEINPYQPQWDLRHWGIYYWANTAGWRDYLTSGDPHALNADPDQGQPHREKLQPVVDDWWQRLG